LVGVEVVVVVVVGREGGKNKTKRREKDAG